MILSCFPFVLSVFSVDSIQKFLSCFPSVLSVFSVDIRPCTH